MYSRFRKTAVYLAAVVLLSANGWAQSIYGGLRGIVTDQTGAAMTNAKVTIINQGTADARSALTSNSGEYVFSQVIPGGYKLVVEFQGFKKFERSGVLVETQSQLTVDVKMEVGNVNDSVQVNEEVPLIETATASQGQVIDRQKLIDLPNLGRNPYMFSRLAPNVQQVGNPAYARMQDQSGSSMISIAGGPVRGNNYLLDGVPITDMGNRAIIIASLEAVQEMKVQANTYDAEIGRSGGGMFNALMKSGTNTFHGSVGGYFRQTDWLANSFFNNRAGAPVSDQPFRNYLGSFGGPVWVPKIYNGKNKTFFFFAFEGYRDTQANSGTTQVPTAAERTGDFSRSLTSGGALRTIFDPATTLADGTRTPFAGNIIPANRINTVGRAIAATFPTPNGTTRFHGDNNMSYFATLPSAADQRTYKLDHKLTSWWNASFAYQYYQSLEPGETWFPSSPSSPQQWRLDRKVNSSQINSTMTLNPTTVLAVRYGFNRFPNYGFQLSQGFNPTSLGFNPGFVRDIVSPTFPAVVFQNFYAGDNMGTNNNFLIIPHSRNFGVALSKFLGKHSLKFGSDVRRINMDGADFGDSAGRFSFTDVFTRANYLAGDGGRTGSDLASLLLGNPADATGFIPTKLRQYLQYYSGFFQDDYRLNSKLTINFGLRWEREAGLAERNNNLIVGFDRNALNSISTTSGVPTRGAVMFAGLNGAKTTTSNPELNKLSPRIGIAYQINSKTTVRGGYGIFWGPQIALTGPYLPEGFTATTTTQFTADGGRTPLNSAALQNIFSSGLDKPVGAGLGDRTGIGKNLSIFDPNARAPRVQQFSIDIQRELPFGVAMSLAYVGSRSTHLTQTAGAININQVEPRFYSLGASEMTRSVPNPYFNRGGLAGISGANVSNAQLLRPFPSFGNVNLTFADYNRARYDSMVLKAQKRMSQGLSFLFAWTWSKNFDATSGGAGNNINGGNVAPQNVYDLGSEYGLSYLDATHRVTQTWTYELPFGKGKKFMSGANKITDAILGGWSINVVSVINSGFPLQIRMNNNNNSIIFASSQRPNATGISPVAGGTKSQWTDGPAGGAYINGAAFSNAPALTFGNVSRTISMRTLRQVNWDMSVFKTISIGERIKAQIRAEALNAMNTPYFRAPNTAFGNSAFGKITSQANFPRFIQLGFRAYF
jgi:hypothetical protein